MELGAGFHRIEPWPGRADQRKRSRGPFRLLPGLVLHGEAGSAFLPGPAAILRDGASLGDVHPSWSDPNWGETEPERS